MEKSGLHFKPEFAITEFSLRSRKSAICKHALSALVAILAGLVFRISATEWLFFIAQYHLGDCF